MRLNATMALAFLMASLRSASSDWRAELITSKAAEEGKASVVSIRRLSVGLIASGRLVGEYGNDVPFLRDMVMGCLSFLGF